MITGCTDMTLKHMDAYQQHTLADSFTVIGRGVHSGLNVVMTVMPAEADSGYVFFRKDVIPAIAEVPARWNTVTDTRLSTTVANRFGIRVSTIEHLLAALHGCGVDNARIVLDGPEVPIMDGSAQPFVDLIEQTGLRTLTRPRMAIVITRPIEIEENGATAALLPAPTPELEMFIDFPGTAIGEQSYVTRLNADLFSRELADSRTFGFYEQIETLKQIGLAKGGSLQNAVVFKDQQIMNKEGLRHPDECVRHKVLDSVGDLSLAGAVILGRFVGHKSGHALNNRLLRQLLGNDTHWCLCTLQQAEKAWGSLVELAVAV